ncbi:BamA/TamA family outer membrane protein [Providencia rustigianii]|uniref:BamA/TamA family outer membrane protein n=1 Tax=Providencia rustigianii TaxID=158850 RepID=UPI000F6E8BD0|nr:BamA/TamA family outer membrane protein [Providencia rustigianii]MTC59797.1 BamA/TamA family outer membrane protein [Providencia rustigianii]VEH53646.1 Outer membrane protein/protective antigen OMA87 [Providencia rustigianii]
MLRHHCLERLILLSLFISFAPQAQILPERNTIDGWLSELGGENSFDESKTIDWGVLPGPFYTPEMGIGIGTALVGLYRIDKQDTLTQPSSIGVSGFASSTGAFGVNFTNYNFIDNDQWRLFISGTINNIPTYYWGKGYAAGKKDSNKEKYHSQEFQITPRALYKLGDSAYVGLGWNFSSINASDPDDGAKEYFSQSTGGRSTINSGVSAYYSYDTRDFLPNAHNGQALEVIYTYFAPSLGSDTRFQTTQLQYAYYHELSEKTVIAIDNYARFSTGEVPWNQLSLLGNSNRMRGYYEGRYRDNNILTSQVELRHKLDWRHGVVGWLGTGTMSNSPSELGSGHWLPTAGVGYRFEFKPRMNVRLDFGVGRNSTGFYFQVGESF